MAKLSDSQIAGVARSAGLSGNNVSIAVAIALAESGGDPNSHNSIPPDNSYGLWQINMLGSLGPARRKQFGLTSNDQLFDPATNARAMMAISGNGKNWKPWTTYTSGRYLLYKSRANEAAGNPDSSVPATPVSNTDESTLDKITDPTTWRIFSLNAIGFLLIIVGLLILFGEEVVGSKVRAITNVVSKVGK